MSRRPLTALSLLALLTTAPGFAADYVVTRYDDPVPGTCAPGDCSLREAAIAASSSIATSDRIFLSAGTYLLTRAGTDDTGMAGDLDIKGPVEILGPGASMTTIDAGSVDRHFHLANFTSGNDVLLRGLTLTNAPDGKSVLVHNTDATIEDCHFLENNASSDADVTLVVIIGSVLTLSGTTIQAELGSALQLTQATGFVYNSTFSESAGRLLDVGTDAQLYCNHCTLFGDDILDEEVVVSGNATLQLANTILSDVVCDVGAGSTSTSFGGNLESPGTSCELDHASDQDGLGGIGITPLAMNGGSTPTHAPSPASFAVNAANDTFCQTYDQRGGVRPDTNCDSGAVELNVGAPVTPIFHDGFDQGNSGAWDQTVD
jgi:hypothetical protein